MAATADLGFDGDDFELRTLDRILTESVPIIDDFVYPSNYPNPTTSNSESFVNSLEIVKITTPVFLTKLLQTTSCCSICTDDFVVDENLTQLPYCRHWFHRECILPWLKRNNTCPLCRHELFKMDIDIEGVEIEDILMDMLEEEGLNERDISQSMETDFSQFEQLLSGSSVSEEDLQLAVEILSESLDESREISTTLNQQLFLQI